MFNREQMEVVKFCAEECKRQHSGEESVADMVNAWNYAYEHDVIYRMNPTTRTMYDRKLGVHINLDFIEQTGKLVEPIDNKNGFRTVPIFVGNSSGYVEKAKFEDIKRLLTQVLEAFYDGRLDPTHEMAASSEDQFYFEFENIHPFRDGNGRTGKILYNYLRGTLDNPVMPPNFWEISNP